MRTALFLKRILATGLLFGLLQSGAFAACDGTDLRASLDANDRADIAAVLGMAPYPEGNHWRASRDGKVIHIIGTVHLNDPRLDPITERLRGIVESSELLLLEMGPEEEEALQREMTSRPELLFMQDVSLPELLSEEDWQTLSAAMRDREIPPMLASRFQPWYLSVLLGMPACLSKDLQNSGQNGLDHRLRDIALEQGVSVEGLEPYDTLFQLFDDKPIEEQLDVMMLGLDTQDQSVDMLATITSAYYEERHLEAWEISRLIMMQIEDTPRDRLDALFTEMEEDLLLTRNQAWIPVILAALEQRTQITVAAGAGHLGGSQGVLALLEKEGFQLERLPF